MKSHLTRGAWIEIFNGKTDSFLHFRRTSHEVRGLKFRIAFVIFMANASHLTRGAWIEI